MGGDWTGDTPHPPVQILHIPLTNVVVCDWQPPSGADITLQVHTTERRLCLESRTAIGWIRFVVDFSDISTLLVTNSDPQNMCSIDMRLSRKPSTYRGSHTPQQEVKWTSEPFPVTSWTSLKSTQQTPHESDLHLSICSRGDLLLGPLHFLLEMDQGIKAAYQAGYHGMHTYQYQWMSHTYSASSQIARQSMENLSTLMTANNSGHNATPTNFVGVPSSVPATHDEKTTARFKPTEFCAKLLRIGSWGKKSYCYGDLKCKFLYVKKRIVWEIIDVVGLAKIEVCFKDISSISVQQANGDVVLFVEIAKLPFFYKGYLQKMKNTRWEHTTDITGGQASLSRTHELHFARGILDPHLERLMQSSAHIKQVTNISPQMLANFKTHHPASGSTIFTTVTPAAHNVHTLGSAAVSALGPIKGGKDGDAEIGNISYSQSFAPVVCSCNEPGQCTTKQCKCYKEGMWCGHCACQDCGDCGNPNNQQLTPCSRQHLVIPGKARANIELDTVVRLPCKCTSVALQQVVSQHSCTECGQQFFYSFCFQSVVSVNTIWHCGACGLCRDFREVHCDQCNVCSFVGSNDECRQCETGDEHSTRADCIIS